MRIVVHSAAIQDRDGPGWSSTRYAGASLGSNSSGPTAATTLGKLRLRWQRRRGCAWRSPSGATTERLRRLAAPLGGRAHLLLVRKKPASRQGLREPCRNSGRLRCPRLDPADPEAACQGVTICLHCKMTEVRKGWVKGPSLTRAAMTRKRRYQLFGRRQPNHERLQGEPQTRYSISASRNAFLCSVLHALGKQSCVRRHARRGAYCKRPRGDAAIQNESSVTSRLLRVYSTHLSS